MLLHLDARVQALWGVIGEDGNGSLEQDGAAIDFEAHEVGGAASNLNASSKGLLDGPRSFKARQETGMDIDQAIAVGIYEHFGDNAHPTGHRHPFHLVALQNCQNGAIEVSAVSVVAMIAQFGGDLMVAGALGSFCRGIVVHQNPDLCLEKAARACLANGFEVTAAPRCKDAKLQGLGLRKRGKG